MLKRRMRHSPGWKLRNADALLNVGKDQATRIWQLQTIWRPPVSQQIKMSIDRTRIPVALDRKQRGGNFRDEGPIATAALTRRGRGARR